MDLSRFSEPVRRVLTLDASHLKSYPDWYDYRTLGIGPDHTGELLEAIRAVEEYYTTSGDAADAPGEFLDRESPDFFQEHAWRALAQLDNPQAAEPLAQLIPLLSEGGGDGYFEDFPHVFAAFGPASVPPLARLLLDPTADTFVRSVASSALVAVSQRHKEIQEDALEPVRAVLDNRDDMDEELNAFIVGHLLEENVPDILDLITRAYADHAVWEGIIGWADVMKKLGLDLPHPNPPPTPRAPASSSSGGWPEFASSSSNRAKAKAKKKLLKKQRKQTRQKKKK